MRTLALVRNVAVCCTLLALAAAGCDSNPPTAPLLPDGDVEWLVLYNSSGFGILAGFDEREQRVIRTEAALTALWDELFGDEPSGPPVPQPSVEFDRFMVLAVGSGIKPDTSHAIAVTAASADGTDLTVTVTESNECAGGAALVEPIEVVQVPRADEVDFIIVVDEPTCP